MRSTGILTQPYDATWVLDFVPDYSANSHQQWGHTCYSAMAEKTYQTTATEVVVETYCEYGFESGRYFGVYINGSFSSVQEVSEGLDSTTVALPPGPKTVTIVNGVQNKPSTTILATQVLSCTFNRKVTFVDRTPELAVLGDSNAVGAGTTVLLRYAWPMLLRQRGYRVSVEAWGYRAVQGEGTSILEHGADAILIALGTNDRWLGLTTAAQLQTNYTALLNSLSAFTGTIYALVPPDIAGIDMTAYQAAVTAAATGRATVLSSHTWDLSDDVHLSNSGSNALADLVEAQCLS